MKKNLQANSNNLATHQSDDDSQEEEMMGSGASPRKPSLRQALAAAEVADVALPDNEPVNPEVAVTEVRTAFEPEIMTFFQFGILYLYLHYG
jgi:hypothetical protein